MQDLYTRRGAAEPLLRRLQLLLLLLPPLLEGGEEPLADGDVSPTLSKLL